MTERDLALVREIALHTVLSRDQIIRLGFFQSVPRANARLGGLVGLGLLKRFQFEPNVSFFQSIYYARQAAGRYLEGPVANLLAARKVTPQFAQHSLAVAEVRIELSKRFEIRWLHECQVRHRYAVPDGKVDDFRPDGLAISSGAFLFVEVDRGNVSFPRLKDKLRSYSRYLQTGLFEHVYHEPRFSLLIATSGVVRAKRIHAITRGMGFDISVVPFSDLPRALDEGVIAL